MKKSKGLIAFSIIFSIISLLGFIPSALFVGVLLYYHGKLYYVILFSLISLVFCLGFFVFLFIAKLARNNNKSLAYLEKNGIKVDNVSNTTTNEECLPNEAATKEELNDVVEESKVESIVEKVEEINVPLVEESKDESNDKSIEEIPTNEEEAHHETVYKKIDNSNDEFKEYLNSNNKIDAEAVDFYINKVEQNQKKREQSIKNEAALLHIQRVINYNDCTMNANFLKYNELVLNMDYIEEVKVKENELHFMIFDIRYTLEFDDSNKVLAFLTYLKNTR